MEKQVAEMFSSLELRFTLAWGNTKRRPKLIERLLRAELDQSDGVYDWRDLLNVLEDLETGRTQPLARSTTAQAWGRAIYAISAETRCQDIEDPEDQAFAIKELCRMLKGL